MEITPVNKNLVIEPEQQKKTTDSGIEIPDSVKERPQKAKVLAVDTDTPEEDRSIKLTPGDMILYSKFAGTEVELEENRTVLVIRDDDVLAILTD